MPGMFLDGSHVAAAAAVGGLSSHGRGLWGSNQVDRSAQHGALSQHGLTQHGALSQHGGFVTARVDTARGVLPWLLLLLPMVGTRCRGPCYAPLVPHAPS
jgi:hypothetical protein